MLLTIIVSVFAFMNRSVIPSAKATYVEGAITHDTAWTLVDSPFVVSNDVTVYSNATLTIEPGVEVRFGGNFSLIVSGRLLANGTSRTIVFTSNKEQPVPGDWDTVKFNGAQKSTLIGCFFAYAQNAISVENGNVEIVNSTISFSQSAVTATGGIFSLQNSTVNLSSVNGINMTNTNAAILNSVITENAGNATGSQGNLTGSLGSGISVTGNGTTYIQGNSIVANGIGVLLTGLQVFNVSITQNIISANTLIGIQIDAEDYSNMTILKNNIASNDYGFYILSPKSTYITNNSISYNNVGFLYATGNHAANYNDIYGNVAGMNVTADAIVNAEYNYWGDLSGPYHEALNPNGRGDPVGGDGTSIDFIFFLTKPIDVINSRPTANLQIDKAQASVNDGVMFYGSNSFDLDGRVNRYLFDFGDGDSSGWTTLSLFTHKYPIEGAYTVNLRVMDDYGAVSNPASTTIYVSDQPPLYVSVELSNYTVPEGQQVLVTVYVTNGTAAMVNTAVTVFSTKGEEFTQPTGQTDSSGYFVTTFTTPDVVEVTNVRIVAAASKSGLGYTDGSDYEYLQVSPVLSVSVTVTPNVTESNSTAQVEVHVNSDGQPAYNASVGVTCESGNLSLETGNTDLNGILTLIFNTPETIVPMNVTITATATKSGYVGGTGQAVVTIEPRILVVTLEAESGSTLSEGQLDIYAHVEYDASPIMGANVTLVAEGGSFFLATEITDITGNATFTFTAPPVSAATNLSITAYATRAGYAQGQSVLLILVNPRTFDVQIMAPMAESEGSTTITIYVTCKEDSSTVSGATVTMSASVGSFDTATKTTDSNGQVTFVFTAPATSTDLNVTLTASISKAGYVSSTTQTMVPVSKATSQGGLGWLLTILLIIIPVVIVIVVVVLIKKKVISISSEEEA
jgi:hypothetical protein